MQTVVRITPALKKLREEELPVFAGKIPTNQQLDAFAEMLNPLLMIKKMSEKLEADKTPTMHLVLPFIMTMATISRSSKFKTASKATRAVVEAFEQGMQSRLKNNGRDISTYCMANYLHPSFKGSLLNLMANTHSYDETVEEIKCLFPEVRTEMKTVGNQSNRVGHSSYF